MPRAKKVDMYIDENEQYPVFSLSAQPRLGLYKVKVTPAFVKRYEKVTKAYEAVQSKLQELVGRV